MRRLEIRLRREKVSSEDAGWVLTWSGRFKNRFRALVALLPCAGILLSVGDPAQASEKSGGFATFAELLGVQTGDEGAVGQDEFFEDVNPAVFEGLNEDLLAQSEIGSNRPGEITLRPDRAVKIGTVLIYPLLRQQFLIDDNIFLTDTVAGERQAGNPTPHRGTRESDFISQTDVGFLASMDFGEEHSLDFGGKVVHQEYTRRSLEFREEFVGGKLRLNFNQFRFEIGDRWEHRFNPIEIEFTNKLERVINTSYVAAGFQSDDVGFEVDYTREDSRFIDLSSRLSGSTSASALDSFDRSETILAARPLIRIDDELWAFIEYAYGRRRMDEQDLPDNRSNQFSVGLRGNPSEQLELLAQIGWIREDFDTDAFSLDAAGNVVPFVDSGDARNGEVVGLCRVIYNLEDLTQIRAEYVRLSQFATSSNFQMLDRGDLSILRQFYPNLLARFGTFYEYARPSNSTNASRFGAGLGIEYLLTNTVSLNADYSYRRRNSSSRGGDFTNNILAFGATVRF